MRQHNLPTCRRHARKEDAHFAVVGKADNQLVNDTILTDGARQRFDLAAPAWGHTVNTAPSKTMRWLNRMLDAAATGTPSRRPDCPTWSSRSSDWSGISNAAGHMLPHEETDRRAKGEMA